MRLGYGSWESKREEETSAKAANLNDPLCAVHSSSEHPLNRPEPTSNLPRYHSPTPLDPTATTFYDGKCVEPPSEISNHDQLRIIPNGDRRPAKRHSPV